MKHAAMLNKLAVLAMLEHGLEPEYPKEALEELDEIRGAAKNGHGPDLRKMLWCSIDNDDSKDLDQLSVAETLPNGDVRLRVSVADVDALVPRGSALDAHARHNTTSVYTAARIFAMLPERLSTDLTSLNPAEDRLTMIIEMTIAPDGTMTGSSVYQAMVRNQAKLAYNSVAAWLEGNGHIPERVAAVSGMDDQLRLQDRVAQSLRRQRHEHGALELDTIQARAVVEDGQVVQIERQKRNRAKDLIEDLMVAANGVTARFLQDRRLPSLRRVVRVPKRWDRIVDLAEHYGETLPAEPSAPALEAFLQKRQKEDPLRFPDLSLAVVKMMGGGEYVVEMPGETPIGHFGLAVKNYAHSTAPNRRYADLVTHRLLKAAFAGQANPYTPTELEELAQHLTQAEDDANKVERQIRKSAAALMLTEHLGERYEALVTGVNAHGAWVRTLDPPVDGKLVSGQGGVDVGDHINVKLTAVDVEHGYIDFSRVITWHAHKFAHRRHEEARRRRPDGERNVGDHE